jgi:hypothetical protein
MYFFIEKFGFPSSPKLSSTQRRYTLGSADSVDNNNIPPPSTITNNRDTILSSASSSDTSNSSDVLTTQSQHHQPQYCRVMYDFQPENDLELGCFSGDYLQVECEHNSDWYKCVNYLGKSGLVPRAYISLLPTLEDDESTRTARDLFDEQHRRPSVDKRNSNVSSVSTHSSQSLHLFDFFNQNNPITSVINSEQAPRKPPIPPKPVGTMVRRQPVRQPPQRPAEASSASALLFGSVSKASSKSPVANISTRSTSNHNNCRLFPDSDLIGVDKKERERMLTLNELIQTEKDYYFELKTCYEGFMSANEADVPSDFNRESVFGKLKPILNASKSLLDSMDAEMARVDKAIERVKIATCLIQASGQMRNPYAEYARSHNDINALVKKVGIFWLALDNK